MATYPFSSRFRSVMEAGSYDWDVVLEGDFLRNDHKIVKSFEAAGYLPQQVRRTFQRIRNVSVNDLFELALQDNCRNSPALKVLQEKESREVFDQAKRLSTSEKRKERLLCVRILRHLPGMSFPEEAAKVLCGLAEKETDARILENIAHAMSNVDFKKRAQYLRAMSTHPDDDVREAVAFSLDGETDILSIKILVNLSRDKSRWVRAWGLFGLCGVKLDKALRQNVLDAILERTSDPSDFIRHDAILGLAEYKDIRVISPLREELQKEPVSDTILKAAKEIAHPDLLPFLKAVKKLVLSSQASLDEAIAACSRKETVQKK